MPTAVQRWRNESTPALRQLAFLVETAAEPDILRALQAIDAICDDASALRANAVRQARTEGATWEEIGVALGITRQAAWERFRGVVGEGEFKVVRQGSSTNGTS